MGDRTTLIVDVRRWDLENKSDVFEKIGLSEEYESSGPTAQITDYEANYGGLDSLDELVSNRIPFTCQHGDGGEYGAMTAAYDGSGEFEDAMSLDWMPILWHDGSLALSVSWSGDVEQEKLQALKEFTQYFAKVENLLNTVVPIGFARRRKKNIRDERRDARKQKRKSDLRLKRLSFRKKRGRFNSHVPTTWLRVV